jgi:hypothetical protein
MIATYTISLDLILLYLFSLVLLNKIHLVYETKDFCLSRVGHDGFQARLIVMHISFDVSAFHIEYIDENFDILENMISLRCKIVFHKRFLTVNV